MTDLSDAVPGSEWTLPSHTDLVSDAAAFLLGVGAWIPLHVLGWVYVGELTLLGLCLGLPVLLPYVRVARERRVLHWFAAMGALYVAALVLTDLYRETAFRDFARGWARALIFLANCTGLVVLAYRRPSRLPLFVAGTVVSQLALIGFGLWSADWKFGFAFPVTVGTLVLLDSRRRATTVSVLIALGIVNLILDYRSFAAACVVAASLVYARYALRLSRARVVAMAVCTGLAFAALYLRGTGVRTTAEELLVRRQGSGIERMAGVIVAFDAIRESPLVGYGSWPGSDDALASWALAQIELGSISSASDILVDALLSPAGTAIRAHSMILQGWLEAGLPGLLFFGFCVLVTAGALYRLVALGWDGRHFALVCFFGVWGLWALLMSPFAGVSRLYLAMTLALLFLAWRDATSAREGRARARR